MFWPIAIACLFFLGSLWLFTDGFQDYFDLDAFFMSFAAAAMGGVIGFAIGMIIGISAGSSGPYVTKCDVNLYAAQDSQGVEGKFFLFGGRVNSYWEYVYYVKDDSGAITMHQLKTENVKIFEDAKEGRPAQICTVEDTAQANRFWYFQDTKANEYEIHVPPGSVSTQINFDLQNN